MPTFHHTATLPRLAPPLQLDLLEADTPGNNWGVRPSARAQRMSARVFRDGRVEIVVPLRARPAEVARFVSQHREWIERTQRRARKAAPGLTPAASRLPIEELVLPALQERWQIGYAPVAGRARLRADDAVPGRLILRAAPHDQTGMRQALVEWLRGRLHDAAGPLLEPIAARMGADFLRVRVGCQRSRWGSCSRTGTVSLNCCLLFQRPEVMRYLFVHELAHRRHMNHSTRFWQHVAAHEPEWRALDRELSNGWQQVPRWVFARPGEAL